MCCYMVVYIVVTFVFTVCYDLWIWAVYCSIVHTDTSTWERDLVLHGILFYRCIVYCLCCGGRCLCAPVLCVVGLAVLSIAQVLVWRRALLTIKIVNLLHLVGYIYHFHAFFQVS
jgi:hypothetical protein